LWVWCKVDLKRYDDVVIASEVCNVLEGCHRGTAELCFLWLPAEVWIQQKLARVSRDRSHVPAYARKAVMPPAVKLFRTACGGIVSAVQFQSSWFNLMDVVPRGGTKKAIVLRSFDGVLLCAVLSICFV
jgi:hypothetical protein